MIAMTQRMAKLVGKAEEIGDELVSMIKDQRDVPPGVLERLWESGFLTLLVPREFDGQGAGFLEAVRVIETLSEASAAAGLLVTLQCLGVLPLVQYASPDQRTRWLRSIVHERRFMAFALSEPEGTGDSKPGETRAVRDGEGYIISGSKVFVSRGSEADLVVLFAVTDPSAGLDRGLSAFLVEKSAKGLLVAGEAGRVGLKAVPWCKYRFDDCRVDSKQLIGGEGQGYGIAAKVLVQAGPLLAAVAVGLMQRALDFCVKMIRKRGAEWTSLNEFQPVEIMLADMSLGLEASRAITLRAAEAFDENAGEFFGLSRHAKSFATESALSTVTRAIEIFGNYGVLEEFPLRGLLEDALVLKGMLGANTLQRAAIVRQLLRPEQV